MMVTAWHVSVCLDAGYDSQYITLMKRVMRFACVLRHDLRLGAFRNTLHCSYPGMVGLRYFVSFWWTSNICYSRTSARLCARTQVIIQVACRCSAKTARWCESLPLTWVAGFAVAYIDLPPLCDYLPTCPIAYPRIPRSYRRQSRDLADLTVRVCLWSANKQV